MRRVRLSSKALLDLVEIGEYIARDNAEAAGRFIASIEAKCDLIGEYPAIGRSRPELMQGLRSFVAGNYVIFYLPIREDIQVLRILHGARDIPEFF